MNATAIKSRINMKDGYIKSENEVKIEDEEITFEDLDADIPHSQLVSQDLCIEEWHKEDKDTVKGKFFLESGYQKLIEEESKTEKNDEEFSCLNCNFIFVTEDDLASHLESSCKGKVTCSQYGTNSKCESDLKSSLLNHKNAHKSNVKRRFKCSECSYECNKKFRLQEHILKHENVKLFKCSDCDYECKQKRYLKKHKLKHEYTELFKCSECSYECKQKRYLKEHILKHQDVKLFKCSDCDYECNRKEHLKSHLLTHRNIKLFKCSECNYEFTYKGSLKRHLLTHGNIKLFKCSKCHYECNQKGHLKRHLQKHGNITKKKVL